MWKDNLTIINFSHFNIFCAYGHLYKRIVTFDISTFLERGPTPPTQELACFVLCFKIINTFLKNSICDLL